jgi:hypothetical protein
MTYYRGHLIWKQPDGRWQAHYITRCFDSESSAKAYIDALFEQRFGPKE